MSLERIVADLAEKVERRFYGKYRGFVVDNVDPKQLGRLKVRVPSVLGNDVVTGWAMPCLPYGGAADQGFLYIPENKAGVWVEFEEGDLEFPIWVGSFWAQPDAGNEMPKPNDPDGTEQGDVQDPPTRKIIKTLKGHTLQFEDADGDEMVTLVDGEHGHVLTMNKDGIKITDAKGNTIEMTDDAVTISTQTPITIEDPDGNTIETTSDGLTITDTTGNSISMGKDAFAITSKVAFSIDASGQAVTITASTVDFDKG